MTKTIYNIPAGVPFAKALAEELLRRAEGQPEILSDMHVFLPTRRACRNLREAFLQLSDGRPLLLPRLQSLGDIDEEELSLSIAGQEGAQASLDIPPAISPLRRQILLARVIAGIPDFHQDFDHALGLAGALGRLMDQIYTEGLDLSNLEYLVPEDFAAHWQITLDFLKILSEHWPKILAEEGMIDGAQRRDLLIRALTVHWQAHPPQGPVIAAGSTGSIPATAELLSTIADLPQGCVVLPGFDADMDEESWEALEEHHPQYGFKQLLERMNVQRRTVQNWPFEDIEISRARRVLASEIMRPAETTKNWQALSKDAQKTEALEEGLKDLKIITCDHEREEAETIAVLMREILEEANKTATLVTSDRNLARRVTSSCRRWGIDIDDSAGQTLDQTSLGSFILLSLDLFLTRVSPVAFLALLKHPLCHMTMTRQEKESAVALLEKNILRGPKPPAGLEGLKSRIEAQKSPEIHADFIEKIEAQLHRFIFGSSVDKSYEFRDFVKSHVTLIQSLNTDFETQSFDTLWSGEEGEAASALFSELLEQSSAMPEMNLKTYKSVIEQMMMRVTVRPAFGTHPRLSILGQIEARLLDADLIIMGGLNEGTWPPDPGHDPWMSRPMRKDFGLPSPERSVGLAAHDFVQGLCSSNVVITRAKRTAGAPSVPARWLQRLDTVLEAAGISNESLYDSKPIEWVRQMDQPDDITPFERPAPTPPLNTRPRQLSATRIEMWLKDPYSIYARYILGLKQLEPLEKPVDAASIGALWHEILERFVDEYPDEIPNNTEDILRAIASNCIEERGEAQEQWSFWWPRFERFLPWYTEHETSWRERYKPLKTENYGEVKIKIEGAQPFTLSAIADRIDTSTDGAAIIDYKTGGALSKSGLQSGELPQLPLEALILQEGGFEEIDATAPTSLSYWKIGGSKAGDVIEKQGDLGELIEQTRTNLQHLVQVFDDPATPYLSVPRPDKSPRFNDYEHLARIKEWSVLSGEDSDMGEAA